jgi:6-pyruvoyltetrahydropterin/6-carboxytetrahydropterin synthase
MYQLAIIRSFQASHHLIGGDWGPENEPHTHNYRLEVRFGGRALDEHGFLLDLDDLGKTLDRLLSAVQGKHLNDLPPFHGLNPSVEHFARILAQDLAASLQPDRLDVLEVRIWEGDLAWASYRMEL